MAPSERQQSGRARGGRLGGGGQARPGSLPELEGLSTAGQDYGRALTEAPPDPSRSRIENASDRVSSGSKGT